jgi:hypothetical protein
MGSEGAPGALRFFGTPVTEFRGLERFVEVAHCSSAATGSIVPSSLAVMRPVASAFRTEVWESPRWRA